MPDTGRIRRIELTNGDVYSIFDEGAIRQNENGVLITGNSMVDDAILNGHFYIRTIDYINLAC